MHFFHYGMTVSHLFLTAEEGSTVKFVCYFKLLACWNCWPLWLCALFSETAYHGILARPAAAQRMLCLFVGHAESEFKQENRKGSGFAIDTK